MNGIKNLLCFVGIFAIALTCSCKKSSTNSGANIAPSPALKTELSIDLENVVNTIDGLCYGINQPLIPEAPFRRLGGNRLTGYNWEINASSAGSDHKHFSDRWLNRMIGMSEDEDQPAAWILETLAAHQATATAGADTHQSMVTVPLAGFVVADANESVSQRETAPSTRWVKVKPAKPGGEFGEPDLDDGTVYVDEEVAWLVSKMGLAAEGGVKHYGLDNEPSIWCDTHPRLHPKKATYVEVANKSIATAKAILAVDPEAQLTGPSLYGWFGHTGLQKASDQNKFNKTHGNFSSYYLSRMREASEKSGKRLLHMFDFHWYPEATAGGTRIALDDSGKLLSPEVVEARLQAPRSLWDPTYVENSWVSDVIDNQPIELIPRMQKIIDQNYPGTRLAILEYSYGAGHHYSGGLATADVLGIFGLHNVAGCLWTFDDNNEFEKAAFRLYLNYDGAGASFEDHAIELPSVAWQQESIYAARSQDAKIVTIILINKQPKNVLEKSIRLKDIEGVPTVRAFRFGPNQPQLLQVDDGLESVDGGFDIECPAHTATLVELKL